MKRLLLSLSLVLLGLIAFTQNDLVHNPITYVDDYAKIIDPAHSESIDAKIKAFKAKSTAEMSIVTVTTLNDKDISEFTTALANKWGVGGKSNNGLMILISPNDHKWFIAVGPGLQGDLTDIKTKELADQIFPSNFRAGQYGAGIESLLDEFIKILDPEQKALRAAEAAKQKVIDGKKHEVFMVYFWNSCWVVLSIIGILFLIGRILRAREKARREVLMFKTKYSNSVNQLKTYKNRLQTVVAYDKDANRLIDKLSVYWMVKELKTIDEYKVELEAINSLLTRDFIKEIDACIVRGNIQIKCKETLDGVDSIIAKIRSITSEIFGEYIDTRKRYLELFMSNSALICTIQSYSESTIDTILSHTRSLQAAYDEQENSKYMPLIALINQSNSTFSVEVSKYQKIIDDVQAKVAYVNSFDKKYAQEFKNKEGIISRPHIQEKSRSAYYAYAPKITSLIESLIGSTLGWLAMYQICQQIEELVYAATNPAMTDQKKYDDEQAEIARQEREKQREREREIQRRNDEAAAAAAVVAASVMTMSQSSDYGTSSGGSDYGTSSGGSDFGGGSFDGGGSGGGW